ncbi:hypothetical protein [Pseudomonas sp. L1(2025)]|uniref:hypothetical protein n=1 Tax=Pseudomonas sp. L1(2025) TaxID=3449429 RepID=UPI003F690CC0
MHVPSPHVYSGHFPAPSTYQQNAKTPEPQQPTTTYLLSNVPKDSPPANLWTGLFPIYEHYPHFGGRDHDDWVSAIKAAMSGLGQSPLSILDEIAPTASGFNIGMKDGFKFHITHEELKLAMSYAKFAGHDEGMVNDARFLFAVMNKRKHVEYQIDAYKVGYRVDLKKHDFGAVLKSADEGIGGHKALELLGLGAQLQHVWSQDVGTQVAVPAIKQFSFKRGMITNGFMDNYGSKAPAPKWIESFIVLKSPPATLPPALEQPGRTQMAVIPDMPSAANDELPDLSSRRHGQKPNDPLLGFYTNRPHMHEAETSVHADVIKLLMSRYGQSPTDVFSKVTFADNDYHVTFRDGFTVKLSREEIELAEEHSQFLGADDGLLKDANFIFAAYIKRQQLQPPIPSFGLSFAAALEGNLNGRTVKNVLEGMGVTRSINYVERAGDAEGLVLMIGGNSGGLFNQGTLVKEGRYYPGDENAQRHGYQLA